MALVLCIFLVDLMVFFVLSLLKHEDHGGLKFYQVSNATGADYLMCVIFL